MKTVKMRKLNLVVAMLGLAVSATAALADEAPNFTCANVMQELEVYRKQQLAVNEVTHDTLLDVANVMNAWYSNYSSYQNRTVYIPLFTFFQIKQSAITEEGNARDIQARNLKQVNHLNDIMAVLPTCLK